MNSELASLATLGLYAPLSPYDSGLPLLLAAVAAIAVTVVVGLPARETVIRRLTQGELLSALVMTMGLSLIAESVISTIWDDRPGLFPSLVEGSVSLTDSRCADAYAGALVSALVFGLTAADTATDMTHGS
ncbi:hypothetical protein OOK36_45825 [Streptomyces sp. NBC_00365]|uniref:hypothetical protein n=1 Tax=Streptomyces sp. NBC_00365 TaxID=2975726 RepID=UPI00224F4D12|nr:hypothetical protein [Streptomyces sp. NBC_00365]MCX5095994.1 hypothetical protein [Streptomyces sp. NBC_00365]